MLAFFQIKLILQYMSKYLNQYFCLVPFAESES